MTNESDKETQEIIGPANYTMNQKKVTNILHNHTTSKQGTNKSHNESQEMDQNITQCTSSKLTNHTANHRKWTNIAHNVKEMN